MRYSQRGDRAVSAASRSVCIAALLAFGMVCATARADDQHPKVVVKGPTSVTANASDLSAGQANPQVKSSAAMRSALRASGNAGGTLGTGEVQETLRPGTAGAVQPSTASATGTQDATSVPQPPGGAGPRAASVQAGDKTSVKREQVQPLPQ